MFVTFEDVNHAVGDLFGHLVGINDLAVRPGQAEVGTEALRVSAQRFNDQVSSREPNGAPPVGVAAFELDVFLRGLIADHARSECEWMLFVVFRETADAVVRQKLAGIPDAL